MAYATASDLPTAYGPDEVVLSSDRDGDTVEDTGAVARALSDASGEMDLYLAVKYELPLALPYPGALRRICVDIALYRLSYRSAERTVEKRKRYEDAIRQLEAIAEGKLGLEDGLGELEIVSGLAEVEADERAWTSAKIGGLL
jgi:phage gp36-like protein